MQKTECAVGERETRRSGRASGSEMGWSRLSLFFWPPARLLRYEKDRAKGEEALGVGPILDLQGGVHPEYPRPRRRGPPTRQGHGCGGAWTVARRNSPARAGGDLGRVVLTPKGKEGLGLERWGPWGGALRQTEDSETASGGGGRRGPVLGSSALEHRSRSCLCSDDGGK